MVFIELRIAEKGVESADNRADETRPTAEKIALQNKLLKKNQRRIKNQYPGAGPLTLGEFVCDNSRRVPGDLFDLGMNVDFTEVLEDVS